MVETEGDIFDALDQIGPLHPKNNTFPGEVFIRLAADALKDGGVSRDSPISEEHIVEKYLSECRFRGWDNQKIRYALLAVGATHGGVEVDLLEEVSLLEHGRLLEICGLGRHRMDPRRSRSAGNPACRPVSTTPGRCRR